MRITPLEIYQQEFKRVLRGVDSNEVEDFLERIADDYEQLIKESADLKEQIKSLKARLAAGEPDIAKPLNEVDADGVIREAKKEAHSIIREARKEADNIIRKTTDEAIQREADVAIKETETKVSEFTEKTKMEELELRGEISRLQAQKERFFIEYRELLEKHLKFLTEDA